MKNLKAALVGAVQAIVGAYLVLVLFFISIVLIKGPGGWSRDAADELLRIAAAGTLAFVWWIVPVGALFGLFARPAMMRWSIRSGTLKAAVLGAGLGFVTAALFDLNKGNTPTDTVRLFYLLIPPYCALWCLLYFGWLQLFRNRT